MLCDTKHDRVPHALLLAVLTTSRDYSSVIMKSTFMSISDLYISRYRASFQYIFGCTYHFLNSKHYVQILLYCFLYYNFIYTF